MLLALGIGYGLMLLAGCAWQRKLLYFPTRFAPEAATQLATQEGFAPWQNSTGEIIGWKMLATQAATGSVLIVHGNAGCAAERSYIARPIHLAADLNVFVMEYPGYGARGGSPSLTSWLAAGEEAFASLPPDQPVYLVAESIGAGVVAHLAGQQTNRVTGAVFLVPYDNLASVAQSKMPWLLPYLFLRDRYKPAAWLRNYHGPIAVIIAERDEVIPPKFAQRLYDSYGGPKSRQVMPGAVHNEVAEQSPDWWREILTFSNAKTNPSQE